MSTALITRREAAELSGASPTTVKKAIDQGVIRAPIEVGEVPVLVMLRALGDAGLPVKHKKLLRDWMRSSEVTDELQLAPALIVRRLPEAEDALERAERYARLRDRWIVRDPDIKGGEPVISGSRVGVHLLADRIAQGEGDDVLDEDFPHIPREAREIAVQYAKTNPRRGRPKRDGRPR